MRSIDVRIEKGSPFKDKNREENRGHGAAVADVMDCFPCASGMIIAAAAGSVNKLFAAPPFKCHCRIKYSRCRSLVQTDEEKATQLWYLLDVYSSRSMAMCSMLRVCSRSSRQDKSPARRRGEASYFRQCRPMIPSWHLHPMQREWSIGPEPKVRRVCTRAT